ncbi:MAG: hypothetical protein R2861_13370 [Desulfobacterales bacterium]
MKLGHLRQQMIHSFHPFIQMIMHVNDHWFLPLFFYLTPAVSVIKSVSALETPSMQIPNPVRNTENIAFGAKQTIIFLFSMGLSSISCLRLQFPRKKRK